MYQEDPIITRRRAKRKRKKNVVTVAVVTALFGVAIVGAIAADSAGTTLPVVTNPSITITPDAPSLQAKPMAATINSLLAKQQSLQTSGQTATLYDDRPIADVLNAQLDKQLSLQQTSLTLAYGESRQQLKFDPMAKVTDNETPFVDKDKDKEKTESTSGESSKITSKTEDSKTEDSKTEATKPEAPKEEAAPPAPKTSSGKENIPSWQKTNSDVMGWLKVPGTNISHAVVQSNDNNYYAEKGYDKQYSYHGVIWADCDVKTGGRDAISANNVLYGHNWTNYSANPRINNPNDIMFGQLTGYHHLSFAQEHPYIYYSTAKEEMVWQVFAAFYTEETFDYIASDPGNERMKVIIQEAQSRSLHNFPVEVSATDKILTLSTCTRAYGKRADQRFVVMAKLMPAGAAMPSVTVTPNTDFKAPQF